MACKKGKWSGTSACRDENGQKTWREIVLKKLSGT